MRFLDLGPLAVEIDGAPRTLGGRRVEVVAAALIVHLGTPLPGVALVDAVWGDDPPAGADELGVEPGPQLRRLHEQVLAHDPVLQPSRTEIRVATAVSPADAVEVHLPRRGTRFVGRDDALRVLAGLFARNRVVTVTGPGGCGKTRLAIEVAGEARGHFPDGVWFVDLSTVSDADPDPADRVAGRVAATLGLDPGPRRTTLEALRDFAADRAVLLLLDNCEQVVDGAAAAVEAVVDAAPAVTVLATSRQPLGVDGEATLPLEPLALPLADTAEARAGLLAALPVLLAAPEERWGDAGDLLTGMAATVWTGDDWSLAARVARTAAEFGERTGDVHVVLTARALVSAADLIVGDAQEAMTLARAVLAEEAGIGDDFAAMFAAVTLGIGAGFAGDPDAGLTWTEEILRRQTALGIHDVGDVLEQRGGHLDAVGRPDDAVRTPSASAARQRRVGRTWPRTEGTAQRLKQLRARLGAGRFTLAWRAGQHLELTELTGTDSAPRRDQQPGSRAAR